jgi:metallo-beta-lactamase family protein
VEVLTGYSAHADRGELSAWLDAVKTSSPHLKDVFLVHGEPEAQDAFRDQLNARGYRARCPEPGAVVTG